MISSTYRVFSVYFMPYPCRCLNGDSIIVVSERHPAEPGSLLLGSCPWPVRRPRKSVIFENSNMTLVARQTDLEKGPKVT